MFINPTHFLCKIEPKKKLFLTLLSFLCPVYRAIPLLSELREGMDWMFTDTTLSILHWLRVQEIYAQVYLVKVRRKREEVSLLKDWGTRQNFILHILFSNSLSWLRSRIHCKVSSIPTRSSVKVLSVTDITTVLQQ